VGSHFGPPHSLVTVLISSKPRTVSQIEGSLVETYIKRT
jgi:hypothetical protein